MCQFEHFMRKWKGGVTGDYCGRCTSGSITWEASIKDEQRKYLGKGKEGSEWKGRKDAERNESRKWMDTDNKMKKGSEWKEK